MNGQVTFVGVAVIAKQYFMFYSVAAAHRLILPRTLVKVSLAVGDGLVVFAMRFFEHHCAKSADSQGVLVETALCVCFYVPA